MAQPIIEKIKVEYEKYKNGQTSKHTCLLKDIPQEDKQYIVSLAILPVYNKDNTENMQKSDISEYIKDFPILTQILYPKQFTSIDVGKIQRTGCPNLQRIVRTTAQDFVDTTAPIRVKGSRVVSIDNSVDKINTYADNVPEGQSAFSFIDVPAKTATKKKTITKKQYLTSEELDTKISQLDRKLEDIMSIVDNPNRIPTKENLKRTLKSFVGRITSEQFDEIVSTIQGININIDKELLQDSVDEALQLGIDKILSQEKSKTNTEIKELVEQVSKLKQSNQEDNKKEMEILALLQKKVPDLIATNRALTDKIFLKLSNMSQEIDDLNGQGIHKKLDDISAYSDLILEELANLGEEFRVAFKEVGLDDETKLYLSQLLNTYAREMVAQIQNGNQDLFNTVRDELKKVITADDVDRIVAERLNEFGVQNTFLIRAVSNMLMDNIIGAMNGLADKNDIEEIKSQIDTIFDSENFKQNILTILKDSDLAKEDSVKAIYTLIHKNHEEELGEIQKCVDKLEDIPNMSQMKELFKTYGDGLVDYLIRNIGTRETISDSVYERFVNDEKFNEILRTLLDASKEKGMTINDLKNFMSSKEGRETFATALGISALQANNQTIISNQAELSQRMTQLEESIKSILNLNLNIYNNSYGLARGTVVGGAGVTTTPVMGAYGFMPVGFAPYMVNPYGNFAYQAPSTATTAEMNVLINNAVKQQLQIMFGQFGVQIPGQPSDINDKDKIIKELNEKIAQKDKEIADLKKQVSELNTKLDEVLKRLENKTPNPTPNPTPTTNPKPAPNPTPNPTPTPKPKKIEPTVKLPEPREEVFIKDSIENIEKLAEPKMTLGKRFRKWIARHPLALTAIGIGAGAVLGAGAGAIMAGGVSALIAKAAWFIPTLQTIGIGAGVGLGLGAVGEIIARVTGAGKKSKLYGKFQKERNNCERFRAQMEHIDKQVELAQESLKASREQQRTGNKILKKLGVYKFATKANRKALRKLKAKARIQKSEYKGKVEKFLKAKEKLNLEEERTGKTMAMGGYLQKLRRAEEKYADRVTEAISRGADQEELDDLADEFEDIKSEIVENAVDSRVQGDISKLSPNFKTGDREAEDIINSVKGSKTATMKAVEEDIKRRNSKVKPEVVRAKYYDPDTLGAYKKVVEEKGNQVDKENFQKLIEHARQANEQARKISSDATPAKDYVAMHPERAQEIAKLLNSAQANVSNPTSKDSDEHTK